MESLIAELEKLGLTDRPQGGDVRYMRRLSAEMLEVFLRRHYYRIECLREDHFRVLMLSTVRRKSPKTRLYELSEDQFDALSFTMARQQILPLFVC